MSTHLSKTQLERDLAIRDLTDPSRGPHGIQQLIGIAADALANAWGIPALDCRGPRIVPTADNYDNLNFTPDAASRDVRYTRYVDNNRMLRSHASAMIPPALRALARARADKPDGGEADGEPDPAGLAVDGSVDDVLLVCPGMVYRRDAIDRLHTGTPHQLDLWRLSTKPLDNTDMDRMCKILVDALTPGMPWRSEPRIHPYTLDGRQIDVDSSEGWIEVWECGLAHPEVLARAGLDGWHGLALGLGLDRFLMLRKGIPDIRLLRANTPKVADQMRDLEPYRPVSAMPAVTRDLSVAVGGADDVEQIGDRVRDALGDQSDAVEEVVVMADTPYDDLPPAAIDRMGMEPGQRNLLVRVIIRHHEQTLTDTEANRIRDSIYAAIHQGQGQEWAT